MRVLTLLVTAWICLGQTEKPADRPPTLAERMKPSLDKQRESVRKQIGAPKEDSGWFTMPWPKSEDMKVDPTAAPPAADPPAAPPPAAKTSYFRPGCDPIDNLALDPLIDQAARRENLPPARLREVIRKESAFFPCAQSPKGASGLMQLMPDTALSLGVKDPFDPAENVAAGARFLRQLLDRYSGDWSLALGAYNAGPATVDALGGLPPYRETQEYVRDILQR